MADTRDEAEGCVVLLRAMGLDVASPTWMSHSGEWFVRALPAGQRGQRQDAEKCTLPNEAS
jgi:hypothetical protein